jgi:putative Mg2+ transporter-C (MgtC) family protein
LGTVIGFERQYRARMAGLRTNALVAVGATLFVLLSANGFSGATADPTRVAAQIVSGIGFLGAGVILRDGLNLRGLNTAATLWCSAAVGALAGAGMFTVALAGTVVTRDDQEAHVRALLVAGTDAHRIPAAVHRQHQHRRRRPRRGTRRTRRRSTRRPANGIRGQPAQP